MDYNALAITILMKTHFVTMSEKEREDTVKQFKKAAEDLKTMLGKEEKKEKQTKKAKEV